MSNWLSELEKEKRKEEEEVSRRQLEWQKELREYELSPEYQAKEVKKVALVKFHKEINQYISKIKRVKSISFSSHLDGSNLYVDGPEEVAIVKESYRPHQRQRRVIYLTSGNSINEFFVEYQVREGCRESLGDGDFSDVNYFTKSRINKVIPINEINDNLYDIQLQWLATGKNEGNSKLIPKSGIGCLVFILCVLIATALVLLTIPHSSTTVS